MDPIAFACPGGEVPRCANGSIASCHPLQDMRWMPYRTKHLRSLLRGEKIVEVKSRTLGRGHRTAGHPAPHFSDCRLDHTRSGPDRTCCPGLGRRYQIVLRLARHDSSQLKQMPTYTAIPTT
jgi:hypothetical protein